MAKRGIPAIRPVPCGRPLLGKSPTIWDCSAAATTASCSQTAASMPSTTSFAEDSAAFATNAGGRTCRPPPLYWASSWSVSSLTQTEVMRTSSTLAPSSCVSFPDARRLSAARVCGLLMPTLRIDIIMQPPRNSCSSGLAPPPATPSRSRPSNCFSRPASRSFSWGSTSSPFLASSALSCPSLSCSSFAESTKFCPEGSSSSPSNAAGSAGRPSPSSCA
mmetsp:Transcript_12556/g.33337  ORF Transcript_12556/g.33337 Transcript_12556/m.33337 type:complete len:219 (-) Transcript_12556:162-818(-)